MRLLKEVLIMLRISVAALTWQYKALAAVCIGITYGGAYALITKVDMHWYWALCLAGLLSNALFHPLLLLGRVEMFKKGMK